MDGDKGEFFLLSYPATVVMVGFLAILKGAHKKNLL